MGSSKLHCGSGIAHSGLEGPVAAGHGYGDDEGLAACPRALALECYFLVGRLEHKDWVVRSEWS